MEGVKERVLVIVQESGVRVLLWLGAALGGWFGTVGLFVWHK